MNLFATLWEIVCVREWVTSGLWTSFPDSIVLYFLFGGFAWIEAIYFAKLTIES